MSETENIAEKVEDLDDDSAHADGITNGNIDGEIKELLISYDAELSELPHIRDFIERLKAIIRRQQKKLKKLKTKLKDNKPPPNVNDVYYQAQPEVNHEIYAAIAKPPPPPPPPQDDPVPFAWGDTDNLLEEVTQAAEEALQTQAQTSSGFVYEPTSGMYYDYSTGYYYNPVLRMYYDGNSGNYLVYDEKTQQYTFADTNTMQKALDDRKKQSEKIIGVKRERGEEVEDGEVFDTHVAERPRKKGKSRWKKKAWPPCLRLMVLSTSVPGIGIGSLFLVTCEGGAVGREGNLEVLLPEASVSKVHIRISFSGETYQIMDIGSRNGTFLNGKRLTPALKESEAPVDITHGDELQIGSTTLSVHVHSGRDTCEGCEPGLQLMPSEAPKETPASLSRRDVLKSLKKRYGVEQPIEADPKEGDNYTDRAEKRRTAVGSSHHAEKTETACLSKSISADNKGFKMLAKMGWSEGKSLGKNEQGRAEPVPLVSNVGATGLGAQTQFTVAETKASRQKKKVLKMTQERYNQQPVFKGNVNED